MYLRIQGYKSDAVPDNYTGKSRLFNAAYWLVTYYFPISDDTDRGFIQIVLPIVLHRWKKIYKLYRCGKLKMSVPYVSGLPNVFPHPPYGIWYLLELSQSLQRRHGGIRHKHNWRGVLHSYDRGIHQRDSQADRLPTQIYESIDCFIEDVVMVIEEKWADMLNSSHTLRYGIFHYRALESLSF